MKIRRRKGKAPQLYWAEGDDSHHRVLVRLDELERRLGGELLAHLLRAMLWGDRIMALSGLAGVAVSAARPAPVMRRENSAIAFMLIACVREGARAVSDALRAGLGSVLPRGDPYLARLLKIATRWQMSSLFKEVRDKVAAHADVEQVVAGIRLILEDEQKVVLSEHEGPRVRGNTYFVLPERALLAGTFIDTSGSRKSRYRDGQSLYDALLRAVLDDADAFQELTLQVFEEACRGAERGAPPKPLPVQRRPSASSQLEEVRQTVRREGNRLALTLPQDDLPAQVKAFSAEIRHLRAALKAKR